MSSSSQQTSQVPTLPSAPAKMTDFKLVSKLADGKFPVYLVSVGKQQDLYAMKVIPHTNGSPSSFFTSEIQFSDLSHPNIIAPVFYEREKSISSKGKTSKSSLIFSEYAPNADFFTAVMELHVDFDDKLARTYFRQLVSGIEFLHSNSIAHLDLKLENIVLDKDFRLRIIDFDLSKQITEENQFVSAGTKNYRAPEVAQSQCYNGFAADVYSMGIILFELLSGGTHPYIENEKISGIDLFNAFLYDKTSFWAFHEEVNGPGYWEADMINLIESLCHPEASQRASVEQIKNHPWMQGEIYSDDELKTLMNKYYNA